MTYLSSFSVYKERLIVSKAFEIQEKIEAAFEKWGRCGISHCSMFSN